MIRRAGIAAAALLAASCATADNSPGFGATAGAQARACASDPAAEADAAQAVQAFFDALAGDDAAAVARTTTDGFFAYELGRRMSGPELVELIASARRQGRRVEWKLQDMQVRTSCDWASAIWVNRGAAGTAAEMRPVAWLESAVLERVQGRWRVAFLNSQRAQPGT
jgi:ketosteroid isomerase-like protein